jgi:hypothetical protein
MIRTVAIEASVEWNRKRIKKPIVVTIVPIVVGLRFPILDIINPEATENTNDTTIYGNWTCAILDASPPNPAGGGLRIKIGRV